MNEDKLTKKPKLMKKKEGGYHEAIGRRKTAIARVRLTPKEKGGFIVNGKNYATFFPTIALQQSILSPFKEAKLENKFEVSAKVNGGGVASQAEAVRLGISRVLVGLDAELRKPLKKLGYLKRDPRQKERRKFGLKKARKAPQWSKR